MEPKKSFFKKRWVIISGISIIALVLIYFIFFSGGNESLFNTVTVGRGTISEEVSATGSIKPVESVELAFERSGRIAAVNADVGQWVGAGDAIAVLNKADLEAQLAKAEADLASQSASLDNARVDLKNDYNDVPNVLNDAYAKSDDAVRTKTSSLFTGSQNSKYQLTFNSCDTQAGIDAETLRLQSGDEITVWQGEIANLSANFSEDLAKQNLKNAENHLNTIKRFLERTNDNLTAVCVISNSAYDAARLNLTTARTNVNTALTSVVSQGQTISSQEGSVASLSAGIKSYEASIDNIKAQISQTAIYAPFFGIVTVQNAKVGEIASAGSVLVSVISGSRFEVEANIAEADIAKVKVGEDADITLDTYGNEVVFKAKVSSIDPAETMVEGVATYKTKFQFVKYDNRIKSGMTANITILTAKKDDVLVVPQRAVTAKDGERSVLIDLGDGKSEERKIQVGLKGVDGNVEALQGLNEGDKVIINSNP
ncbi:MAG: efflux RND transporter periplasmic adaptor subunit [Minisyncoccia bacterium]